MNCSRCDSTFRTMRFTSANVALCEACYRLWLREPTCMFDAIAAHLGLKGTLIDAPPEARKRFTEELAQRTKAWVAKETK